MKRMVSQKRKSFWIVLGLIAVLAVLLTIGSSTGGVKVLSAETAATPEERAEFLRSCGWEIDPTTEEAQTIHIPEQFTAVYEDYNALQIQQGYDLSDYAGQDCTLYSYTVLNYPDTSQTVIANLYLYRDRVIGGDVHSTNLNGFMIGIK